MKDQVHAGYNSQRHVNASAITIHLSQKAKQIVALCVYIHLQSESLVRKGLNLFMEKEITILPLEFLAQLLSWNRTAT